MIKKLNSQYFLDQFKRSDAEAMIKWLKEIPTQKWD